MRGTVQQLLASVAGGSGLPVIKFLCKGPLKTPLGEKVGGVATEVFERERRLEAKKRMFV